MGTMLGPSFTRCFAPSFGVSRDTAKLFGLIAETTIGGFYLKDRGKPFFFPVTDQDFGDFTAGFANVTLYTAFLKMKNPHLRLSQLLDMRRKLGGDESGSLFKVPDLVTDNGAIRQFYEIKPNSATGLRDGDEKLANLSAFCDFFKVSYKPGTAWSPDKRLLLYDGVIEAVELRVKVFFHFFRVQPGLIVYELCIEAGIAIEDIVAKIIVGVVVLAIIFGPEILAGVAAAGETIGPLIPAGGLIPVLAR
ncbi:hypothetical protein VQH23_23880 [Pararoseomonas sp. SCSIO 73927]|uniref:hypothetical protein n=1 Tax=Pararoseomonas sp. SCSIO 73927 TaxID=3114537 RepID=UPI0030D3044D